MSAILSETEINTAAVRSRWAVAGSFLLHVVILLLLLHRMTEDQQPPKFFPVELVQLVDRTTTPVPAKPDLPRQQTASVRPQSRTAPPPQLIPLPHLEQTPAAPEKGVEPIPQPPKDELQSRLESFSKLTVPGDSAVSTGGSGSAYGPSSYDLKDFIRAQVERKWSLDLGALEDRKVTVFIHVVLAPDGVIKKAQIVNDQRSDAAYHSLAISARNAVLLSSPIILPTGTPASALDVILNLSPEDTLN
jgi:hypothetical protein